MSFQLYSLAYLTLLELVIFFAWPGYTLGQCAVYGSLCFFVFMGSRVMKGSLHVNSIRKSDRTALKNADEEIAPLIARSNSIYPTKFVSTQPILDSFKYIFYWYNMCRPEIEAIKTVNGRGRRARQVNGFYDIAESATRFLSSLDKYGSKRETYGRSASMMCASLLTVVLIAIVTNVFYQWSYVFPCEEKRRNEHTGMFNVSNECSAVYCKMFAQGFFIFGNIVWFFAWSTVVVTLAILLYGCDIAHSMTRYWLIRFRPLRRLEAAGSKFVTDNNKLESLIKRDAYERYLFCHNYMDSASSTWSVALFLLLAVSCMLFVYGYSLILYVYKVSGYLEPSFMGICAVTAGMIIFVLICMTYANAAVDNITKAFCFCSVEDYKLLGGREEWMEYTEKAPVYWYIFGFAITRSWLVGFLGGSVTTVAGTAVLVMFGLG